jgi:hypothetical protein
VSIPKKNPNEQKQTWRMVRAAIGQVSLQGRTNRAKRLFNKEEQRTTICSAQRRKDIRYFFGRGQHDDDDGVVVSCDLANLVFILSTSVLLLFLLLFC